MTARLVDTYCVLALEAFRTGQSLGTFIELTVYWLFCLRDKSGFVMSFYMSKMLRRKCISNDIRVFGTTV